MFIIFVAHTPRDWWALWIPARFGFSDATEIFVFCSGMASAIAFGAVFDRRGWLMGAARIAHRVWQVYWAHIGLFFAVFVLVIAFDTAGIFTSEHFKGSYVAALNLTHFFTKTPDLVVGLFTLTYVPNYFDILPMYLVILAMIPIVMGLSQISLWAVAAFVLAMWSIANLGLFGGTPLNFSAEPWSARDWFFNPLGWQLVFFTGFAFMRGWLPEPRVERRYLLIAAAVVLATVPFAYFRLLGTFPELRTVAEALKPLTGKTQFGILRYVHFLALAYLAWAAVGPLGARLQGWGHGQIVVDVIRKVGQQSLAVFISSLVVAQMVGMVFRVYGNGFWIALVGNLAGFAALIAVAYSVAWFKGQPWRAAPPQTVSNGSEITVSGPTSIPVGAPAAKAD